MGSRINKRWCLVQLLLLCIISTKGKPSLSTFDNIQTDEIITIKNKTHVLCATRNTESPIFINPPVVQNAVSPPKLEVDGWQQRRLEDFPERYVVDKRWEGSETRYTNFLDLNIKKSVSFSVFDIPKSGIEFFYDDDDSMDYIILYPEQDKMWDHFDFILSDGSVHIYRNDKLVRTTDEFQPTRLVIKTLNDIFFKIHNYTFLYTDTPTNTPSKVQLLPETSCVDVYVSICSTCYLQFRDTIFINENNQLWQNVKINSPPQTLEILRGRTDDGNGNKDVFWAIDIRECPKMKNNLVLYELPIHASSLQNWEETQCLTLDTSKTNVQKTLHAPEVRKCNIGEFGQRCDIKCQDLLDKEKNYCQKSKICENGACFCAWGFKGDFCHEECSDGEFGIECKERCSDHRKCKSCEKFTGTCTYSPPDIKTPDLTTDTVETLIAAELTNYTLIIVLGIAITVVICIILLGLVFWCIKTRPLGRPEEQRALSSSDEAATEY